MKSEWDRILLLSFSIVIIIGLIVVTLARQTLNNQQWFICTTVLAFGGAGFAAFLPGSIQWQVKPGLKATGAFAVLLLVFLVGSRVQLPQGNIKEWSLIPPTSETIAPNKDTATVYVQVNDHVVRAFGTTPDWVAVSKTELSGNISLERGAGGLKTTIVDPPVGSKLLFVVQDEGRWWMSDELIVPPPYGMQLKSFAEPQVRRRLQP